MGAPLFALTAVGLGLAAGVAVRSVPLAQLRFSPPPQHAAWPRMCAATGDAAAASEDGEGLECDCVMHAPSPEELQSLRSALPTPSLQPREVITTMMHALHRSSWDTPRPYFGFEVALNFLSPSHQYREYESARTATPESLARYLQSPHKAALLAWNEFRWEGETTVLEQREAYQQVSVRASEESPWTSVRWMLTRVPADDDESHSQWMVDAVFVSEPDPDTFDSPASTELPRVSDKLAAEASSRVAAAIAAMESPPVIVEKVMRALRHQDEPYRLHGAEVAVRYCAPTNPAAALTPATFASYLKEPWYQILAEWDEMVLDDEGVESYMDLVEVGQAVMLRRKTDTSWSVVNFGLSRHNGRWLIHSLIPSPPSSLTDLTP